ncbi:MAG TPA: glycosyltransferase [Gemmataceae bacterium]|nr:glycosyltransferase [Gemmataceae bacterium]
MEQRTARFAQWTSLSCTDRPRILILTASVGTGHLRAAEALALALRQMVPQATIESADVLALATAPFRYCYAQFYLDLIHWAPEILGIIYNHFDRPCRPKYGPWYRLRVKLEEANLRPYISLLKSKPWDVIINTFFLPAEIVAALRRRGEFAIPQVMVVTDFETHRNWVTQPCELYCTATQEAAQYLQWMGVPASATAVTGIPIHPVFRQPKDRTACRQRQGFAGDRPAVLLLAGGHGAGPIEEPLLALLESKPSLDVLVVAGQNVQAQKRLRAIVPPPRHRVRILGYTDQMDELLAAADLVVTKPGGLTVSEALARGAGLMLINPIPGQEERNCDYLLEQGAAIKVNHLPTLRHKIAELLGHPATLERLRNNARRLGRPHAAFEVARRALALLHPEVERSPVRAGTSALSS